MKVCDDLCLGLDKMMAHEEVWVDHCAGNFDVSHWLGADASGDGWGVTPLSSPGLEG
jgi:hypothetical protein